MAEKFQNQAKKGMNKVSSALPYISGVSGFLGAWLWGWNISSIPFIQGKINASAIASKFGMSEASGTLSFVITCSIIMAVAGVGYYITTFGGVFGASIGALIIGICAGMLLNAVMGFFTSPGGV